MGRPEDRRTISSAIEKREILEQLEFDGSLIWLASRVPAARGNAMPASSRSYKSAMPDRLLRSPIKPAADNYRFLATGSSRPEGAQGGRNGSAPPSSRRAGGRSRPRRCPPSPGLLLVDAAACSGWVCAYISDACHNINS